MAAPRKPPLRILRSEASHAIAFIGRALVVHWEGETRFDAVAELTSSLINLSAEHGSLGLLQVIGDRAIPPDGEVRAQLATMLKSNENRILASAVVFEGGGFRASIIRSIVIGIAMLSRPKCPHTVFASAEDGIAWLSQHFGSSWPDSGPSLQLAIERLRQRAPSAAAGR